MRNYNILEDIEELKESINNYIKRHSLNIENMENYNENITLKKYNNFHLAMSSFFDFYLLTLQLSLKRDKDRWLDKEKFLTGISTITFWRLRASYLIFKKGYAIEAISLLRGALENILTMIALLNNIITTENTFVDILPSNIDMSNKEQLRKVLRKNVFKIDEKIKKAVIGKDSPISPEAQKMFAVIFRHMHSCTHKSMENIYKYVFSWMRGEIVLYPLPTINDTHISTYVNLSAYLAKIMIGFLPNIYENSLNKNNIFVDNYNKIKRVFNYLLSGDQYNNYIEEFIMKMISKVL